MKSTFVLIALCVVAFLLQQLVHGFTDNFSLVSSEAPNKPWMLLTSIFLHGDFLHLGYNMLALFFFGLILENIVGTRIFTAIFFVSGIDASFVSLFFYERSLGASGAIFGIIGALALLRPRMTAFALGVPMPVIAAAAVYFFLDILGVFYPSNIANVAHIAGLLVGGIAGFLLRRKFPEPRRKKTEKIVSERDLKEWEEKWIGKTIN